MLNLAVADDLFILSLPFNAHSTLTERWAFGAGACKILSVFYRVRRRYNAGRRCYTVLATTTSGQIVGNAGERRSLPFLAGERRSLSLHDRCGWTWTRKTAFSRSMSAT